MNKAIGSSIYEVDFKNPEKTSDLYYRVTAKDLDMKEAWFQDAVVNNPELVISPLRETNIVSDDEKWFVWSKEQQVETGDLASLVKNMGTPYQL